MTTPPSRWWDCSRYGDVRQPRRTLRSPDVRTSLVDRQTTQTVVSARDARHPIRMMEKDGALERHSLWKIRCWPICCGQRHHRNKPVRVRTIAVDLVYYRCGITVVSVTHYDNGREVPSPKCSNLSPLLPLLLFLCWFFTTAVLNTAEFMFLNAI